MLYNAGSLVKQSVRLNLYFFDVILKKLGIV
jgi:hypothetical protein